MLVLKLLLNSYRNKKPSWNISTSASDIQTYSMVTDDTVSDNNESFSDSNLQLSANNDKCKGIFFILITVL